MTFKNKTKFISSILIAAIILPVVLFSIPHRAQAVAFVPVNDTTGNTLLKSLTATITSTATTAAKETLSWGQQLLQQAIRFAAKKLLAKITESTVKWINSGFHGSPLFLENPSSFFKDIAKSEVKFLVDAIGYDPVRFPFGRQTALNIIDSYKRQLSDNAEYTLSKVINDPILLGQYQNNFNYGGWNGFLINTQYPQNNYLGFNMIIGENLQSRLTGTIQSPAQKVKDALDQGMGFLSPQECKTNPNFNKNFNEFNKPTFKSTVTYTVPALEPVNTFAARNRAALDAYDAALKAEKDRFYDPNGTTFCPPYPDGSSGLTSTTPGSVAAHTIMKSLDIPLDTKILEGAIGGKDISDSIAAILDALINQVVSTGLNKLKGAVSSTPPADNWNYDGHDLNGNNTSALTLNIPQNVSVDVDHDTSTKISGGNGNYIIQGQPIATIATARISGDTLTITGKSRGSTAVVVNDTSTPSPYKATVYITVNETGDLRVLPANIRIDVNDTMTATVSGGTPDYDMTRGPDTRFARADFADGILIISGVAKGSTSIEISDSSEPVIKIVVPIEIKGTEELKFDKQNLEMDADTASSVEISGGTKPYFIDQVENERIAKTNPTSGQIPNTTLGIIAGSGGGQTEITILDSSSPAQTARIIVIVTAPDVTDPES